ncbi:MAG: pyridoxamine 5'-phosphate oxidase family protein [Jiangellaceae bacterium]
MVGDIESGMIELDADECWRLLADGEVGRLAVAVRGEPEIFPVNYAVDAHAIVFRTGEGTKLAAIAVSSPVAFEIDDFDTASGKAWSVVARGQATILEALDEVYKAAELPIFPWHRAPKPVFVRIADPVVTGRRFSAW